MIKAYYIRVKKLTLFLLTLLASLLAAPPGVAQQSASLKADSLEAHEGLTITARPWPNPSLYKEKFPKKSPYSAGVLAIQVAFRNDSGESLKVNLELIRLSVRIDEDNRQELQPLTADEVADAVLKTGTKDPTATRKKFPFPTSPSAGRTDKKWVELQKQAQDAAVPSGVVAPHTTVQGLLYFDLRGQFDLLPTAHLYVPDVLVMEKNKSLMYFEIDLSRPGDS